MMKSTKRNNLRCSFYFYLTGISLITRAGFPARTTLSPKDLVIAAPCSSNNISCPVSPRKDNNTTFSPEIVSDSNRFAVFNPKLRSCVSSGWRGVKIRQLANHGIVPDANRTNIQHGQVPIRIKIFP